MTPPVLVVSRPGLLTTIQDLGRWGHQSLGVPVAGPMDTRSLRWANAIVGNDEGAAGLEITLLGPSLRAIGACRAAVAGAEFEIRVDGERVETGRAFDVGDGQTITFGTRLRGARAYLAVAGGIDTPPVLGSRATHLVSRMGGLDGRALAAGDVLPVGRQRHSRPVVAGRLPVAEGIPGTPCRLRVMLGPQDDWFSPLTIDRLASSTYQVSGQSDRMGFRLDGPPLTPSRTGELISEPVAFGAIQVPSSGVPILLMADRQTAGGYPKIASVIAADLPRAGQLAPGDQLQFVACSRHEALAALIAEERAWLKATSVGEPA